MRWDICSNDDDGDDADADDDDRSLMKRLITGCPTCEPSTYLVVRNLELPMPSIFIIAFNVT